MKTLKEAKIGETVRVHFRIAVLQEVPDAFAVDVAEKILYLAPCAGGEIGCAHENILK